MEETFLCWYFLTNSLLVFLVLTANIRYVFNSSKNHLQNNTKKALILIIVGFATTVAFLPLIFTLVFFFALFRLFLGFFLKFKHAEKFGGFLENLDCGWTMEDISKAIILQCMVVQFEGTPEELSQKIRKRLKKRQHFWKNTKMGATKHEFLGYQFILNDEYDVDDSIRIYACDTEEKTLTEEIGQKFLTRISNESLPKNHRAFWELVILNKPIKWGSVATNQNQKYLVVLRVHHSLCDGICTQKIIVGCLSDFQKDDNFSEKQTETLRGFGKITKILTVAFLAPTLFILYTFRNHHDTFRDTNLCGDRVCVWKIEKEPKYFQKVQDIKKILPEVTFTEIILTAMSASFMENILKDTSKSKWLSTWVTTNPYLRKFPRQHYAKKDLFVLNNDVTSTSIFWAPGYLGKNNSDTERLRVVQQQYSLLKNSYDAQIAFWMFRVMAIVTPIYLSRVLFHGNCLELGLANLPGLHPLRLFEGCPADDIFMYSPNYSTTGFSFNINTYQGRFQLALTADKTMVADENSARDFLGGVFKHLDQLHGELCQN